MDALKWANDILAFLLELAALAALAVWGFTVGVNLSARLALGCGAPTTMIVVWGIWLAPTSDHRLVMPWLLVVKLVVFGLVTAALAATGRPRLAAAFAVLVVLNLGLAALWARS